MARKLNKHQKKLRDDKRRKLEKLAKGEQGGQNLRSPEIQTVSEGASRKPSGGEGVSLFSDPAKSADDAKLLEKAIKRRFPIRPEKLQGIMWKLTDMAEREEDKKAFLAMTKTLILAEVANQRDELANKPKQIELHQHRHLDVNLVSEIPDAELEALLALYARIENQSPGTPPGLPGPIEG